MSRYRNADQIKDVNGKRRKQTWIIRTPPANSSDLYIQITSPDRLDILADKLYGDQSLWYIIAQANGLGKGSYRVPEATILRIPVIAGISDYIVNVNKTR
jgi:hypothetical protein